MSLGGLADPQLLGPAALLLAVALVLYLTLSGFAMVGVGPGETIVLLFLAPFLAGINLPVYSYEGTIIGVNAAGLLVPVVMMYRFLRDRRAPWLRAFLGIAAVSALAYAVAEIEPGTGILVPALPIAAAATGVGILLGGASYKRWGPLTFASGAGGTLVGADLLNLSAIASATDTGALVIGGAGTLDAIYLCGVWAVGGSIAAALVVRVIR